MTLMKLLLFFNGFCWWIRDVCVSCRKKTYFVSWERSKVDIVTLRFNKTKGEQVNCCWPKQLNWVDEDAIIKNLRFQKSWGLFFNLYLQTIMFNCFIRSSICWGISIVFTHFNEMWFPKLQCMVWWALI